MRDEEIRKMSLKEFSEYCNDRSTDGQWSINEAVAYSGIMSEINSKKVKHFGFIPDPFQTRKLREETWESIKAGTYTYGNKILQ